MWQSIKNKIIRKLGGIVKEDLPESIQNNITMWQVRVMGDFAKATRDKDAAEAVSDWNYPAQRYIDRVLGQLKNNLRLGSKVIFKPENVDIRDEEQCPHCGTLCTGKTAFCTKRGRDTGGWFRAWWNGEEQCWAREVEVIVGKSPKKTWWCAELEGTRRKAIEVKYDDSDHTFLLDNEDGSGFFKVTLGRGSPQVGHSGLPEGTRVVRVIEK